MTRNTVSGSAGIGKVQPASESRLIALATTTFGLYLCTALSQNGLAHPAPGSGALGRELLYSLYLLVTAGIFGTYGLLLAMCAKGELAHGRLWMRALVFACVLQTGLALLPPTLSEDMLTYSAVGFLGALPGHNPLVEPPAAASLTAIGADLHALGWTPDTDITPYGIIWTSIEAGLARLAGGNLTITLFLLKCVALAASLTTAFLLNRFVGRLAPQQRQLAVLAYLWNPLILIELVGEGHNDALLVLCAVAALAACAFGQTTGSVFLQLCGVLTKYITVLFAPAQLVFLWRTRRHGIPRLILEIAAGTVLAGALGAFLYSYSHVWVGVHSFNGTIKQGQPLSSASLLGVINWTLRRSAFAAVAGSLTLTLVSIPTLAFVIWMSLRVRDAAGLARACAWIAVVYLLVASPAYWPWYAALPVTLLIAADTRRFLWVILMLTVVARVVAPLNLFQLQGLLSMQLAKGAMTGLGSLLPLLVLLVWYVRGTWLARARNAGFARVPATQPTAFSSTRGADTPPNA